MNKAILLFTLAFNVAVQAMASVGVQTMAATVKADYNGRADSMNYVLVEQFLNKTKGTFYSTPFDVSKSSYNYYWQQAHAMDVLVYAYPRLLNSNKALALKYKNYFKLWYNNHANNWDGSVPKTTGFENEFTDDMAWICLTLLHMTEATNLATYAATAQKVFDNTIMARAVEDSTGLWVPWNINRALKINSCTITPCCLIAVKLYERTGQERYLTIAEKFWKYQEDHLVHYDAAKGDYRVEEPPLSYTQGTFGEACRRLYHITGHSIYRLKAQNYFNYFFTSTRCGKNNIIRNEGTDGSNAIFKAVLMPYVANFVLDESMGITVRKSISGYVQKNAESVWKNLNHAAYPAMYCPYGWADVYDETQVASLSAMASGASLMENCARMCNELLRAKDDEDGLFGVSPITQENVSGVYTLSGRLVCTPFQDIDNLPAGLYIINGRKTVIQK